MWIKADFLDNNGDPATGLSPLPTIRIRDLADNSLAVTDDNMVEVGDGTYKYWFATYSNAKDYSIRCDAGSALTNRYAFASSFQDLEEDITFLKNVEGGDWILQAPNDLIFYEEGEVGNPAKIVAQWKTFNEAGLPAIENITKCVRN